MNLRKLGNLAVLFCMVGLGLLASAQRSGRLYDPAKETTLTGKVTAVNTTTGRRGWNGVHLTVQASEGTYDVHVGPAAYLTQQGFSFAEGDQVEIVGSKMDFNGAPAVIAREVKRGDKVLSLRDKQGIPLWSRGRGAGQ